MGWIDITLLILINYIHMGDRETEISHDPDQALSDQVITDTMQLAEEGIDRTIIAAYEKNQRGSVPDSGLHGEKQVYFHVGISDGENPYPTVTMFFKPSGNDSYVNLRFGVTEGQTLMRGSGGLSPEEVIKIGNIAKNRPTVDVIRLEEVLIKSRGLNF